MKLQDIYPAVLTFLLVAVLIGVGLTVMANMSREVRITTTATDDQFAADNSSCVAVGTYIDTATATFENLSSDAVLSSCFTWNTAGARLGSCVTLNTGSCSLAYNGKTLNTTYTYGAATAAQTQLDSSITAVGGFVTWFSILVVIIAAAIIIGIVIRSFSGR